MRAECVQFGVLFGLDNLRHVWDIQEVAFVLFVVNFEGCGFLSTLVVGEGWI